MYVACPLISCSPALLCTNIQIRGAVGDTIAVMIQNIVCMAYGLIIAFVYNWRMALLMLGALPFMISGSIIYYNNIRGEM
jgi:ABC-type multidrug transport system fused ATPase/permease subunit